MLAALLACAAVLGDRPLDKVVLNDGTRLEGCVVLEAPEKIVVRVGTKDRVVPRKDVKTLETRLSAWREALDRWRALEKDDPVKIADLGVFARRMGLSEEARVFALRAIASDPENAAAREILGHERKDKGWFAKEDGRRWAWAERVKRSADYGLAWQLETTHWKLRTNLPLVEATTAILDLEAVYDTFMTVIAPEVGAFHLAEPLAAQIHADRESFPESSGSRGYYDRDARVLFVNAADGLDRGLMAHEALHQVLAACSVLAPGARGEIAPWLEEGLAEYFRATLKGPPGRMKYEEDSIDTISVRSQAHAQRAYTLNRVLSFATGDFLSTSRQDLKYAQSYTLVHFLMHADGRRWRPKFYDFLRGAWQGQGSSTDFEKALGAKSEAIEKAWVSWVAQRAK
jgi:hypothetical protein